MNKLKILIVDDETFYIDILVDLLEEDYKLVVAKDGEQAIKRAKEELPDLILLDWLMPGIDGLEVCQKLKADPKTQNIPLLFLTVKSEIEDEIQGFGCGAIDYIRKPISPPIVKARVKTHLKLKVALEELEKQNEELKGLLNERTAQVLDLLKK